MRKRKTQTLAWTRSSRYIARHYTGIDEIMKYSDIADFIFSVNERLL